MEELEDDVYKEKFEKRTGYLLVFVPFIVAAFCILTWLGF